MYKIIRKLKRVIAVRVDTGREQIIFFLTHFSFTGSASPNDIHNIFPLILTFLHLSGDKVPYL